MFWTGEPYKGKVGADDIDMRDTAYSSCGSNNGTDGLGENVCAAPVHRDSIGDWLLEMSGL